MQDFNSLQAQSPSVRSQIQSFSSVLPTTIGMEGGGSPNGGIPVGGSATFILNITGGTLTDSFANESAVFTSQLIRFRGFNGNPDSDKDTVTATPNAALPEPASLLLAGLGLLILSAVAKNDYRQRRCVQGQTQN